MSSSESIYKAFAADYAACRPAPPTALIDCLVELAPGRGLAWDCATGNGQTAELLAERFEQVIATDHAEAQIREATLREDRHSNVEYRVGRAERSGLPSGAFDLITVSQAVHWFDRNLFYAEVRRLLAPGGVIAVWGYHLPQVSPEIDRVMMAIYESPLLSPWWPPEKDHVHARYESIEFPFERIGSRVFHMEESWDVERFERYLKTWPAFAEPGVNEQTRTLFEDLRGAWNSTGARTVLWEIFHRIGRV